MSKSYTKKTHRSRRKMNRIHPDKMQVKVAEGKASFQMVLPMNDLMLDVARVVQKIIALSIFTCQPSFYLHLYILYNIS